MSPIQSLDDLERFRQRVLSEKQTRAEQGFVDIIVSMGSCGIAAGACETLEAVKQLVDRKKIGKIRITETGCIGLCKEEPVVEVRTSDGQKYTYGHVTPEVIQRIVEEHILNGKVDQDHLIGF